MKVLLDECVPWPMHRIIPDHLCTTAQQRGWDAVKNGDGGIGYADESQAGDLGIASIKVGDEYVVPSAEGAAADLDVSDFENPEHR